MDKVFQVNPGATQTELHDELEMILTRIQALAIQPDDGDLNMNEELSAAYMGTIYDLAKRGELIVETLGHQGAKTPQQPPG